MLHLLNIYHENKDSDNCAQVLEEECIRMFGTKYLNDEHDCNMNSLNIHDANDMQSHKLGKLCLMEMIFFVPQAMMSKFTMMKACHLSLMIIVMTRML